MAALAVAAAPGAAGASIVVYRCGAAAENLCSVNPDGSGRKALMTDGTADLPYVSPSLTRDGSRLAFVHSPGDLFVADTSSGRVMGPVTRSAMFVAMRPDGGRIGAIDLYPSLTGTGFNPIACSFDAAGGDRTCSITTSTLGWSSDGRLLVDHPSGNSSGTYGVCAVTRGADGSYTCAPFVAVHPDRNVRDPAVSPDGRTVAATLEEPNQASGRIVLFDPATGQPRRDLTTGTRDGSPAWSPDGASIAFERAGSIYIVAASGGGERLLTAGATPTWGGPKDVPAPLVSRVTAAATQRGAKVRADVVLGRAGSTVKAVLLAGGKTVGSATKGGAAAGKLKLSIPLSSSGLAKLKKAHKLKLTLRITVTAAGAKAAKVTRQVTLKR